MSRRTYFIFITAIFLVLVAVLAFQEEEVDWTPSYSRYHKKPFGSYILYEMVSNLFPDAAIKTSHETIAETLAGDDGMPQNTCYLFSGDVALYETELETVLEYVYAGNHAFLTSTPLKLMDTLGVETDMFPFSLNRDSTAKILLNDEPLEERTSYPFRRGAGYYYFTEYPCNARVLSTDEQGYPVTLSIPYGDGTFVINTTPLVFTNFYMLNDTTRQYISRTLSYFPAETTTVIWDEFYRTGRAEARTPLRVILTTPPLKWAYYIALIALALYMITEVKRRQRMIPIIRKPGNATVDFVTTVGRLYFQQGNHKDLARKKISYFLEDLRRRYFLRSLDLSEGSAEKIAMKSGVPQQDVLSTFQFLRNAEQDLSNEFQLLTLNDVIENFYKKIK